MCVNMRWFFLTALAHVFLGAVTSYACDPCGMHNSLQLPGVMSSMRSVGLQSGAWTFGLTEQFSTFRVRSDNDLRTTDSDIELIRNLSVTQVTSAYNISESFSLQVNLPLVIRNYYRFERFAKVSDTEAGLGDMSILSSYSPYSYNDVQHRIFFAGFAGLKVPTGDTGSLTRVASQDGDTSDDRIQGRGLTLGTGSVDVPLGIVAYGRSGRMQAFASAQYTIRTEGASEYRFANDLSWSISPGWLFLIGEDQNISASLALSGETKGGDHLDGELLSKTAVNNLYLGPELFYSLTNRISILFGIDLPIAIDVGGAAVKPETRSRFAVSMSF